MHLYWSLLYKFPKASLQIVAYACLCIQLDDCWYLKPANERKVTKVRAGLGPQQKKKRKSRRWWALPSALT